MINNIKHLNQISNKYHIPSEDLLLLDLNLSGIKMELQSRRVRFELKVVNQDIFPLAFKKKVKKFYLAVPTVDQSSYFFKDNRLFYNQNLIGKSFGVTEDYCDSSYPRRGGTVLNINPNAATMCKGCKFCYTRYQVPKDREPMLSEDKLQAFLNNWIERFEIPDLSHLIQVAVVTGAFPGEKQVVDFLKIARNVLGQFSFTGELLYFGSQITSQEALLELEKIKPLAICYTVECFDKKNRDNFLRNIKNRLSFSELKKSMAFANSLGIRTNFSYIAGLDSLETVKEGFQEFLPYINSFPIVNALQVHKGQENLRHSQANEIDYYIKARNIIQDIFTETSYRPKPWENYRSLWYLKFGKEDISDIRTPLPSTKHKLFDEIVGSMQHKT